MAFGIFSIQLGPTSILKFFKKIKNVQPSFLKEIFLGTHFPSRFDYTFIGKTSMEVFRR
jgi:hypothetical protein